MLRPAPLSRLKLSTKLVAALAAVAAAGLGSQPASAQFDADDVIRMNRSNPIITVGMFPSNRRATDGANINGPSMIRIPDWIPRSERANANANYYLYFGHHDGDYIRMAWSRNPTGPFTLYRANAEVGTRGVMDNNNTHIRLDEGIQIRRNHIASPDVHVDNANQKIILYFHSGSPYRFNGRDTDQQVTWVNTSDDGLFFRRRDTEPVQLGPSYFRVFEDDNTMYAFHNNGGPVRARSFNNPWRPTAGYYDGNSLPSLWEARSNNLLRNAVPEANRRVRHTGVRISGSNAQVFYSIRGDSPERIFVSNINLNTRSWNNWNISVPGNELLRAVGGWEGGQLTPRPSVGGQAVGENQLRDPYPFQDTDGSLYLFYTGQGEDAMGVAAITSDRQRITVRGARHDAETRSGSNANRNLRSNTTMVVRDGSGSNDRRVHLSFDAPGGNRVDAAVLRVFLPNNASGNLDIYASQNFNEATVTGATRPSQLGSRLDRIPLGQAGFYEFDVTDHVNANRTRPISLVIRSTGNTNIQMLSSEANTTIRRPQLKWLQRR